MVCGDYSRLRPDGNAVQCAVCEPDYGNDRRDRALYEKSRGRGSERQGGRKGG
ncbi:hypothetical protein D1872_326230 [compost metagenome]